MSRIGKQPITVPAGVEVTITEEQIMVKGPKGELTSKRLPGFKMEQAENVLTISKVEETPDTHKFYGLQRTLINNMVVGVSEGFSKVLEINGVGYRGTMEGKNLNLSLGFSHKVLFTPPEGVDIKVEGNTVTVSGYDKQKVGEAAAKIRSFRKPEPYKGKGIKYAGEHVRRKAGKTAAKGA